MKERNRGRDRDNGSEGVPGDLPDDCIYATVIIWMGRRRVCLYHTSRRHTCQRAAWACLYNRIRNTGLGGRALVAWASFIGLTFR
jgi:hypothetical protein